MADRVRREVDDGLLEPEYLDPLEECRGDLCPTRPAFRKYARWRDAFGCGIFRLWWMWQTHTSPVRSNPRMRSRVTSASALKTDSISASRCVIYAP